MHPYVSAYLVVTKCLAILPTSISIQLHSLPIIHLHYLPTYKVSVGWFLIFMKNL
jgi:hypothetical protein